MIIEVSVICLTVIVLALIGVVYSRPKQEPKGEYDDIAALRKMIDDQAYEIKKLNSKISVGLITRSL